MSYIREDQARITVALTCADGVVRTYPSAESSWFSAEGGSLQADESKTRPGGMGKEQAIGGQASRDDLSLKTQFDDLAVAWCPKFEEVVGKGAATITIAYIDANGAARAGNPVMTYTGILKGFARPDFATDSSSASMIEAVFSLNE